MNYNDLINGLSTEGPVNHMFNNVQHLGDGGRINRYRLELAYGAFNLIGLENETELIETLDIRLFNDEFKIYATVQTIKLLIDLREKGEIE